MADQEVSLWVRLKDGVSDTIGDIKGKMGSFFDQISGVGVLAIGSITGAFVALKKAIDLAGEAQATEAETVRITEQIGTKAGWTSEQIAKMSEQIGENTGVMKDDIQAGINLLALHTNLSGDSMPKVAQAAADLAAHMNGGKLTAEGYKSAVEMLASSLENPQRGMMALSRATGALDDAQKEYIKTLIANGDLENARQVLLDAVIAKVKGAAEQTGTWEYTTRQARKAVMELVEDIGKFLLPVITMLVDALIGVVKTLGDVVAGISHFGLIIADVLSGNIKAIQKHHDELTKNAVDIVKTWQKSGSDIAAAWNTMVKALNGSEEQHLEHAKTIHAKEQAENQINIDAIAEANKVASEAANQKFKEHYDVQERMQKAAIENEIQAEKDRGKALSDLGQLANSKNRELYEIGKQASAVEAGIKAGEGAVSAYASLAGIPIVGPFLGAAAAAALIAYGAEQVANIESQNFPGAANQAYAPGDGATVKLGEQGNPEWVVNQGGLKEIAQAAGGGKQTIILQMDRKTLQTWIVKSEQEKLTMKREGRY